MNCPHCQQPNELLTRAGQRLYYRCARCGEVYWGLAEGQLGAPAAPKPHFERVKKLGRSLPLSGQPAGPKPDVLTFYRRPPSPARRDAIRALLRQVKTRLKEN